MSGLDRTISHALMTFCRSLPNMPKNSFTLSGNTCRSTPRCLEPLQQLHRRRLAHLAVRVADDGDFLPALDRARQRKRPHRAGAHRAGDDVARVAQPDELIFRHAEHRGEQRIQPHVNARQRDDRQFVGEICRVQTGIRVARHRAVVRFNDGFKEAHNDSGLGLD